jgi:hypothetical protein
VEGDSAELRLVESLGLDTLRRGRPRQQLTVEFVRELTAEDVAGIGSGQLPAPVQPLARVEAKHHALARLLASGASQVEAALAIGYTPQRVHQLTEDELFVQVLDYYRTQAEARFLDAHERLGLLGLSAAGELQKRLDETPERLTTREVKDIAEFAFDRSTAPAKGGPRGPGGGAAPVQVNISFPAQAPQGEGAVLDLTANAEG